MDEEGVRTRSPETDHCKMDELLDSKKGNSASEEQKPGVTSVVREVRRGYNLTQA